MSIERQHKKIAKVCRTLMWLYGACHPCYPEGIAPSVVRDRLIPNGTGSGDPALQK